MLRTLLLFGFLSVASTGLVGSARASADEHVWIEAGDQCGFLGEDQNLVSDADQPIVATIRVFPYGSMQVLRTFIVRIEAGDTKYLGCSHPEQGKMFVYQMYRARYAQ